MSRTPGKFIVIEGGDFCGKTTFAAQLERVLLYRGISCDQTRLPGGDQIGEMMRSVLVNQPLDHRARAYLFAANRAHLSDVVLKPLLKLGRNFICTRWKWSSNVYQGYVDLTNKLDDLADVIQPDAYILLECTDEVMERGLKAKRDREDPDNDEVDLMDEEHTENYQMIKDQYRDEYEKHQGTKFKYVYNKGGKKQTDQEFIEEFKELLEWFGYFEREQEIPFHHETQAFTLWVL